ncbi:hypothetical protein AMAG_17203 [Allomyces macrogynus ATCC 38327]|uniref:SWIM-type domain-containing protein n=1 Tax=Allomyces macrogynus (strain ATCC 38327) TaxID=578462 RepID=A0A0L0TEA1_ALLM3|nr:hypothetical protein AMAG_17203 [Allomyces macrogynus ATCC 38327]|eukprot:KNE72986.1 hypothetical protein AMAG_17203 [Allomyces macrogynus ATCC 38327]
MSCRRMKRLAGMNHHHQLASQPTAHGTSLHDSFIESPRAARNPILGRITSLLHHHRAVGEDAEGGLSNSAIDAPITIPDHVLLQLYTIVAEDVLFHALALVETHVVVMMLAPTPLPDLTWAVLVRTDSSRANLWSGDDAVALPELSATALDHLTAAAGAEDWNAVSVAMAGQDVVVRCLVNGLYCSCAEFEAAVLQEGDMAVCQHLLAVHLALHCRLAVTVALSPTAAQDMLFDAMLGATSALGASMAPRTGEK